MSPQAFEDCIKNGGRVRTKKIGKDKHMHICWLNGKSSAGEVMTNKSMRHKSK